MDSHSVFGIYDEYPDATAAGFGPLFALVVVVALVSFATALPHALVPMIGLHYFLGFMLCALALLKLTHPLAFADSFQRYDLLAQKSRFYALCYPYIELLLGLGYLSFSMPYLVYALTLALMLFSVAGIFAALRNGVDTRCPHIGRSLRVRLSTVTLVECMLMILVTLALMLMRSGLI
ncbi:MAG: MauE/DoxX family redox-associated membrane protein [Pseudomonadota bacterium]